MGEFLWTFAVASVAFLAGYIMCSLLLQDRIGNVKRRVREVCANPETTWRPGEGLGLVRVESIRQALDGTDD